MTCDRASYILNKLFNLYDSIPEVYCFIRRWSKHLFQFFFWRAYIYSKITWTYQIPEVELSFLFLIGIFSFSHVAVLMIFFLIFFLNYKMVLILSFVTPRLDSWNSVLTGLSDKELPKFNVFRTLLLALSHVFSFSAHYSNLTRTQLAPDQMTYRVNKISSMSKLFMAFPLSRIWCSPQIPFRPLCSAGQSLLTQTTFSNKILWSKSLQLHCNFVWSDLPLHIRQANSQIFKGLLKTHLLN